MDFGFCQNPIYKSAFERSKGVQRIGPVILSFYIVYRMKKGVTKKRVSGRRKGRGNRNLTKKTRGGKKFIDYFFPNRKEIEERLGHNIIDEDTLIPKFIKGTKEYLKEYLKSDYAKLEILNENYELSEDGETVNRKNGENPDELTEVDKKVLELVIKNYYIAQTYTLTHSNLIHKLMRNLTKKYVIFGNKDKEFSNLLKVLYVIRLACKNPEYLSIEFENDIGQKHTYKKILDRIVNYIKKQNVEYIKKQGNIEIKKKLHIIDNKIDEIKEIIEEEKQKNEKILDDNGLDEVSVNENYEAISSYTQSK